MVQQRQNRINASSPPGKSKSGPGGQIWKHLPRLMNSLHQHVTASVSLGEIEYEPIHLDITPSQLNPVVSALKALKEPAATTRLMAPETFRFIMEQAPTVRTIEFGGKADPLENPAVIDMVDYAFKFNGAESTLITDGLLLEKHLNRIMQSDLRALVIRIHAHKPSAYRAVSGRDAHEFTSIQHAIEQLIAKRPPGSLMDIELLMTLDVHNIHNVPEMIAYAQRLKVDGIRFENYLSPTPGVVSDRSLFRNHNRVKQLLREYRQHLGPACGMNVTWPTLLDKDMAGNRYCLEPFNTLSLDSDCNVSGCSRQWLIRGRISKIWDSNFWDSDSLSWLRNVHGRGVSNTEAIPLACQGCPKNISISQEQF